jgi:trigger factor
MQVTRKDLPLSQVELTIELSVQEFSPYIDRGAQKVSERVKIEGFRPGKVPVDILKQKVGDMTILEEAANVAIQKTIDDAILQNTAGRQAIGQPQVNVTKLAPDNDFEYKVVFSILPEVTLGKYKELGIKTEEQTVTDSELDKAILDLQEHQAHEVLADRPVEARDKVVADVHISVDKVPIENGDHHDLAILLGKNYFVPGFDDNLLGAKKGESRDFTLNYPADHHQSNLAGKKVEFSVKIKEVYSRELHELNDEFASHFGLKKLEDLKEYFRNNLLREKTAKADQKYEAQMLEKIIADTKFGDLPAILVDSEAKNMLSELEQSVIRQGGNFEDYLGHLKKDRNTLLLDFAPNAVKRVKSALVIRELSIVEKIDSTPEEIKAKKDLLKLQYAGNEEALKMFSESGYDKYLQNVMTNEKVITKLKEWNYVRPGAK